MMQKAQEEVTFSLAQQPWLDSVGKSVQGWLNRFWNSGSAAKQTKNFLNGVWLAHPVHAAVTDVPVGAWTTALAFDLAESATGRDLGTATSTAIGVGLAGAAASAVSGLADWSDTGGEQRRLGVLHALTNVTATVMYAASLWGRLTGRRTAGKVLSTLGYATVSFGAYLGGDLAYRLGTQVDRNAWRRGPKEFEPVIAGGQLRADTPTKVEVEGLPIVLVKQSQRVYALGDVCSHAGCSLSRGHVEPGEGTIMCRCHGSTYKLEDGSVVHGPSPFPQPRYDVEVREGQVYVRSPRQRSASSQSE